jgi:hypothetical protein
MGTARIVDAIGCLNRPDYSASVTKLLDVVLPNIDEGAGSNFLS